MWTDSGIWTDDRVTELKRLWAAGMSGSAIGSRMGKTRSAVIGKEYRLRLPARKPGPVTARRTVRRSRAAGNSKRIKVNPFPKRPKTVPTLPRAPLPDPRQPLAGALMLPLLELEAHHCRFPHDTDSGLRFCGCTSVPGTSWCPDHLTLVSAVPVRPRPALVLEAAE